MFIARRRLIESCVGVAATLSFCPSAFGQALVLTKIPWKPIIEGVSALVTAVEIYFKLKGEQSSHEQTLAAPNGVETERMRRFCGVSLSDIRQIEMLITELALATNTFDYEAAVELGNGGLLPALVSFTTNRDAKSWRRVRNDASHFVQAARALIIEATKRGGLINALDDDDRRRVLAQLNQALKAIDFALEELHYDRRSPSKDDDGAAQETLARLRALPELLNRAKRLSNETLESRAAAKCN